MKNWNNCRRIEVQAVLISFAKIASPRNNGEIFLPEIMDL